MSSAIFLQKDSLKVTGSFLGPQDLGSLGCLSRTAGEAAKEVQRQRTEPQLVRDAADIFRDTSLSLEATYSTREKAGAIRRWIGDHIGEINEDQLKAAAARGSSELVRILLSSARAWTPQNINDCLMASKYEDYQMRSMSDESMNRYLKTSWIILNSRHPIYPAQLDMIWLRAKKFGGAAFIRQIEESGRPFNKRSMQTRLIVETTSGYGVEVLHAVGRTACKVAETTSGYGVWLLNAAGRIASRVFRM